MTARSPSSCPRARGGEPPEAAALERDEVRLLVAERDRQLVHAASSTCPRFLAPGDLLVVNTSATHPRRARRRGGERSTCTCRRRCRAHRASRAAAAGGGARAGSSSCAGGGRFRGAGAAGEMLALPARRPRAELARAVPRRRPPVGRRARPARAAARLPRRARAADRATATRRAAWPLEDLPDGVRRPSRAAPRCRAPAARSRQRVSTALRARGRRVAPLVLHTGVSSLERGERPYPERFRVPALTASRVNAAARPARRVIAVGTTVVRALETVAAPDGTRRARRGLDRPRRHARARRAGGRRPAHRLARAGGVSTC